MSEFLGQIGSMAQQNLYQQVRLHHGNQTLMEKLEGRRAMLENDMKQTRMELEAINNAIERLNNSEELAQLLEALNKAKVL